MTQVRIGVIGTRGRGRLAKHWHDPEGKSVVVAGADVLQEALDEFRREINEAAYVTTDYRDLLSRDGIDAIAVMAPDHLHEKMAVDSLKAGKHVFCEKPLAISTEGCDNILRAWKESGKHLMVGFNMRYMPMFRTMKGIIDSGLIGEIKAVWVRHFVGFGGDYYFHDWHANRKNTNSLLLQKGSHDIDMIHWLTGQYSRKVAAFGGLDYFGGNEPNDLKCSDCDKKDTCPEVNYSAGRVHCAFRQEVDVEDNNVMIMELDGGIKASYLECHFTPEYFRNYTLIGTEGRIENVTSTNRIVVKTRKSGTWKEYADATYTLKDTEGGHGGADPLVAKDFIDMLLYGKQPVADPWSGRMSVAAGCAAAESIRAGGKIVTITCTP